MKKSLGIMFACCLCFGDAYASETGDGTPASGLSQKEKSMREVLVSANKIETPSKNTTTGINVIYGDEIEEQRNWDITQTLILFLVSTSMIKAQCLV